MNSMVIQLLFANQVLQIESNSNASLEYYFGGFTPKLCMKSNNNILRIVAYIIPFFFIVSALVPFNISIGRLMSEKVMPLYRNQE
jgi:hypothetical protein